MSKLVAPHGGKGLVCALLEGAEHAAEMKKAATLKQIEISARTKGDLIMMGIGGFSPLTGFMNQADWKGVCENFQMADGTFWPVPITFDVSAAEAASIKEGEEIATKIPAVPGVPGKNVLGEIIEPKSGKDFRIKTLGDARYDEESLSVKATRDGVLSIVKNNTIKVHLTFLMVHIHKLTSRCLVRKATGDNLNTAMKFT